MPVEKQSRVGFLTPGSYLVFRLWTVPSGLVPRVSCLIASSLSIITNFFCSPCWGLLFFYSSCLPQCLNGLVIFPTFFNVSLNLSIRSSWSKPQSSPSLVFADCIELLHLWLEKGMANQFSILALRTPWTVWKGKMIGYWKRNSPGR